MQLFYSLWIPVSQQALQDILFGDTSN